MVIYQKGRAVYVLAATKRKAQSFIKKRGMRDTIVVGRVEDLPREMGLMVVLVGDDYHNHPDYELLFGVGGLFYDFKAYIYYGHEVPALN